MRLTSVLRFAVAIVCVAVLLAAMIGIVVVGVLAAWGML